MRATSRLPLLLATILGASGCAGSKLPIEIPQLKEAQEITEYGGDRTRAGRSCHASSETMDAYIACMDAAGYVFIPRDNLYPSTECWTMRDANDPARLPPSYCFHRTNETAQP